MIAPARLCLLALMATVAAAVQPDLLLFDSNRSGNYELYTMDLTGGHVHALTSDTTYDSWWGRPSPDGAKILFYRTPKGVHDSDYGQTSLWRINSDGTGLAQLRAVGTDGWTIQGHGEWSPDGGSIATLGTASGLLQVFVLDANGANPFQVTTGGASKLDCSWSHDGLTLLCISTPTVGGAKDTQDVYTVPAAGGALTRLLTTADTIEDYDPYFSPDDSRVAWLSQTVPNSHGAGLGTWNIRICDANGANLGMITNDTNINSKPEWSRDGSTIYFHRLVYTDAAPKFDIYSVPTTGTGVITKVNPGAPGANEYPACLRDTVAIALTAPAAGAVSGTVTISATVGSASTITSVHFQVDGVDVATDAVAPYAMSWNSAGVAAGSHSLRAIVTDAVGGTATSASVVVTTTGSGGGGGGGGGGSSSSGGHGCGSGSATAGLSLLVVMAGLLKRRNP